MGQVATGDVRMRENTMDSLFRRCKRSARRGLPLAILSFATRGSVPRVWGTESDRLQRLQLYYSWSAWGQLPTTKLRIRLTLLMAMLERLDITAQGHRGGTFRDFVDTPAEASEKLGSSQG